MRFFVFDSAIGEATVPSLPPGTSTVVSVTTSFADVGYKLIKVKIDPNGAIPELSEANNEASLVLQVGQPPVGDATIVVTASDASGNPSQIAWIAGRADYDFISVPGQQDYPVQGGQVTVTVKDPDTAEVLGIYTGSRTNTSGTFNQAILAPAELGTYTLLIEVTGVDGQHANRVHVVSRHTYRACAATALAASK